MFGLKKKVEAVISMTNLQTKRITALERYLSIEYNAKLDHYQKTNYQGLVSPQGQFTQKRKPGRPKGSKNKPK